MDKLIKEIKEWHRYQGKPINLSKWFRMVMFDFIVKTIKNIEEGNKFKLERELKLE